MAESAAGPDIHAVGGRADVTLFHVKAIGKPWVTVKVDAPVSPLVAARWYGSTEFGILDPQSSIVTGVERRQTAGERPIYNGRLTTWRDPL